MAKKKKYYELSEDDPFVSYVNKIRSNGVKNTVNETYYKPTQDTKTNTTKQSSFMRDMLPLNRNAGATTQDMRNSIMGKSTPVSSKDNIRKTLDYGKNKSEPKPKQSSFMRDMLPSSKSDGATTQDMMNSIRSKSTYTPSYKKESTDNIRKTLDYVPLRDPSKSTIKPTYTKETLPFINEENPLQGLGQNLWQTYKEDDPQTKMKKAMVNYLGGSILNTLSAPASAIMTGVTNLRNMQEGKPLEEVKPRSFTEDILTGEAKSGLNKFAQSNPIGGAIKTGLDIGFDPTTWVGGMGLMDDLAKVGKVGKAAQIGTKENLLHSARTAQAGLAMKPTLAERIIEDTFSSPVKYEGNFASREEIGRTLAEDIMSGMNKQVDTTNMALLKEPAIRMPESSLTSQINKPASSGLEITTLPGKYAVGNKRYEQAVKEYEDAIQVIQNHFGTDQLRVDEIPKIRAELGIDLDNLVRNMEKTQNIKIPSSERMRLKKVSGVMSPGEQNIYDTIKASKNASVRPNASGNRTDYVKYPAQYTPDKGYPNMKGTKEDVRQTWADRIAMRNKNKPQEVITPKPPATPTKQPVKSIRQLPNIKDLTPENFDAHYGLDKPYTKATVTNLVEDMGARIINKTGSNNLDEIAKYYEKKYNLPKIKVVTTLSKETRLGNTIPIKDKSLKISGYRININPNQSVEGAVGSLRHEIEHAIDLQSGYRPGVSKYKFNPKDTTRTVGVSSSTGHHKNYEWFEADYLYNALKKDAQKGIIDNVDNAVPKNIDTTVQKATEPTSNIRQTTVPKQQMEASNDITPIINTTADDVQVKQPTKFKTFKLREIREVGVERERGMSRNVRTSTYTDDKLRASLENDPLTYNQTTLNEIQRVADKRFSVGYEKALDDFKNTNVYDPADIPLSKMLANEAAKRNDYATAREVLAIAAEKATEAGRMSVANKLLREADPSTFVSFVEKKVKKINEQGAEVYGKKWKDVKLTDEDVAEIYNLELFDETTFKAQSERIYNRINEQLPVTKFEKLDSWRRISMLLNPKTHVRNVIGNALMLPLRKGSDVFGAAVERIAIKDPSQRTKSVGWSFDKKLSSAVEESWQQNKLDLMHGGRYDLETLQAGTQDKRIFKQGIISKGFSKVAPAKIKPIFDKGMLESVNEFSKNALNAGDVPFLKRAYKDALGGFMKARGLKEVTEDAITYATRRAQEATYRQTNMFSNWIAQAKKKPGLKRFATEAVIPFSKTPSNIVMRAVEYSPTGLLKAMYSKHKGKDAAMVIEDLCKGMTGSAVVVTGFMLANMGWLQGESSKSKNVRAIENLEGEQAFSINTPLGSYTFDWAAPISIPLAMGVAAFDGLNKKYPDGKQLDLIINTIIGAVTSGGETAFNMSMLKSIKDLFGGYGGVAENLLEIPGNYISQMLPTFGGQIGRTIDSTKRNTYDTNPVNKYMRTMSAKIPGASFWLEPQVDIFGRNKKQGNAFEQFLNPGYYLGKENDKVTNEISRLYGMTKETDVIPKVAPTKFTSGGKQIVLTPKEVTYLQRNMGKQNYTDLNKLFSSEEYKEVSSDNGLTAEEKTTLQSKTVAKIVKNNYDYWKEKILQNRQGAKYDPDAEVDAEREKNRETRRVTKEVDNILSSVLDRD